MSSDKEGEFCPKCTYPLRETPCPICADREKEQRRRHMERRLVAIEALGGLRAFEDFTIEKMIRTPKNTPLMIAVENFEHDTDNLFIYGPSGSGKTHLATALARKHFTHGSIVLRSTKLLQRFRNEIRSKKRKEGELMKSLLGMRILVLDDIGVEKGTEFAIIALGELVDAFWMAKRGGLVITSNLSLQQLSEKLGDDRITSRIAGMCRIFKLDDEDYRLVGKK